MHIYKPLENEMAIHSNILVKNPMEPAGYSP